MPVVADGIARATYGEYRSKSLKPAMDLIALVATFGSYDRATLRATKTVKPETEKHRSKARTFVRGLSVFLAR